MKEKSDASDVIHAIGNVMVSIIGTVAVAAFFCGNDILPWNKNNK